MSEANFSIEGFCTEPKPSITQNGKPILSISVAHSPRRLNKQTNQWEDVTDRDGKPITVWARATFFNEMADHLATIIKKGDYVRLEGEPRVNVYMNGNEPAGNIDIQFAKLSIVPRKPRQQDGGGYSQASGHSNWGNQLSNEPPQGGNGGGWGNATQSGSSGVAEPSSGFGGGFDDEQPF